MSAMWVRALTSSRGERRAASMAVEDTAPARWPRLRARLVAASTCLTIFLT
ncbi:MAG: hypothetical protein ACMG6S_04025 [Byssovorax sp.]